MAVNQNELIEREMQKRGVVPPTPQQEAPQQTPEQQKAAEAQIQETAKEEIQEAVTPTNETTKEPPAVFKVRNGDQEIEYTEDQINGMASRYRDLNFKRTRGGAGYKIVDQLLEHMGDDPQAGDKIAHFLSSAIQASQKNPQMGGAQPNQQQADHQSNQEAAKELNSTDGWDLRLDEWGNENDIDTGPLKAMFKQQSEQAKMMQQGIQVIQQMQQQLASLNPQAQQEQTQTDRSEIMNAQLSMNVDNIQREFGFSNEMYEPFVQFAKERGYTEVDFLDYDLLRVVAQDFTNNKKASDYQRLEGVMNKRSAVAGSLASTPSSGAQGGAPAQQSTLDRIVDRKMSV